MVVHAMAKQQNGFVESLTSDYVFTLGKECDMSCMFCRVHVMSSHVMYHRFSLSISDHISLMSHATPAYLHVISSIHSSHVP